MDPVDPDPEHCRKGYRFTVLYLCPGGDGKGGRGGLAAPGRHIRGGQQEHSRGQGPQGEITPHFLDLTSLHWYMFGTSL